MEKKLKTVARLYNYATKNEDKGEYCEALKCHKECVQILQQVINEDITSESVKQKMMSQALVSIKRGQVLENLILHLAEAKKETNQSVPNGRDKNIQDILQKYFESEVGQKHTQEQIECIQHISKIINISNPTTTMDDIFGMEGETNLVGLLKDLCCNGTFYTVNKLY